MQDFDLQRFAEDAESAGEAGSENVKGTASDIKAKERLSFSELINGEYKSDFTDKVNDIVSKRFKELKKAEERLTQLNGAFSGVMAKRGANTLEELIEKLSEEKIYGNDKRNSQEELKKDLLLENYRKMTVSRQYSDWIKEADEVKKMYPDFDILREIKNPVFKNGLKLGMDITSLYRALHFDEISKEIEDKASSQATLKAASYRNRPSEIGSTEPRAVKSAFNVNALTDEDMEKIVKRIARGDKISFSR